MAVRTMAVCILSSAAALGPSRPARLPHYESRLHKKFPSPMTPPSMFLEPAPNFDEEIPIPWPIQYAPSPPSKAVIAGIPLGMAAAAALFASAPALGSLYSASALATPLRCSIITASIKGLCSDLFAQLVVERRGYERRRTLAFISFNSLYIGAFGWYKYNFLYNALFGSATSALTVALKVFADLGLCAPLVYFPLYYVMKGAFAGQSPLRSLREFFAPAGRALLCRYWVIWTPVEIAMWLIVPKHLRVAFLCSVSLVWQVVLSTITYSSGATAQSAKLERLTSERLTNALSDEQRRHVVHEDALWAAATNHYPTDEAAPRC